jgi:tRNA wybutosine-synthesizing protein 3
MSFELDKKNCLNKVDKSKKGHIDKKISKLVELINNKEEYFTTSSCSGRIMIYTRSNIKNKSKWIFVSHNKIKFDEINFKEIKKLKLNEIWFKQESFILHLRAKDLQSAEKLLKNAREIGLKKSGLKTISKNINIEIFYHLNFDIPIKVNNQFIDENFFKEIIIIANKNLNLNLKKIKEFEDLFS